MNVSPQLKYLALWVGVTSGFWLLFLAVVAKAAAKMDATTLLACLLIAVLSGTAATYNAWFLLRRRS
jgi:hypothetical protein